MGSFILGLFLWLIPILNSQAKKVECLWEHLNLKHQKQVKSRVDRYWVRQKTSHCRFSDGGFVTLPGLMFLLLGLTLVWCLLARMLTMRAQILSREQIIDCTADLERQSLIFDREMLHLNNSIRALRTTELVASAIPTQQATALAARIARQIAQSRQQLITFNFGTKLKLPFESCRSVLPIGLIMFDHHSLILTRDKMWFTAQKKIQGKTYLWKKNLFVELIASRKNAQVHFWRSLKETSVAGL